MTRLAAHYSTGLLKGIGYFSVLLCGMVDGGNRSRIGRDDLWPLAQH
jgi:hypothetical protein